MNHLRLIAPSLLLISACLLCFEIIATRISSVIFVNNYAFFILSLSVLGLGSGGILAYYRFSRRDITEVLTQTLPKTLFFLSLSLLFFIFSVTLVPAITNPFFYFLLLFIPFFLAGIFYAIVFTYFAKESFLIYASDLIGAAAGSLLAIAAVSFLGPINSTLLIFVLIAFTASFFKAHQWKKSHLYAVYSLACILLLVIFLNGGNSITRPIPIGEFPEKDFYHVYPDPSIESTIIDSRWSIFGRSDLVSHSHQDMVRHLFVDGAAGSQMYRFDGNPSNHDMTLQNLLLGFSSTIPLLFLEEEERENMLIIGPGGGKEVVAGLISGVKNITGVEINRDFVDIVKDYSDFNGGIYTDFPNVDIRVMEGRQYVQQTRASYDIIKMVLPSTQQVQHIENYALSENYLLTVEALEDYFSILKPNGRIIVTVYNEWELKRLILTAIAALDNIGIDASSAPFYFKILDDRFAPTVVFRKKSYYPEEIVSRLEAMKQFPPALPRLTYVPYQWDQLEDSRINRFMAQIYRQEMSLAQLAAIQPFDIRPVFDDSPYFYKIEKGIPEHFKQLLFAVLFFNVLAIAIPFFLLKKIRHSKKAPPITRNNVRWPLLLFSMLGLGFMIAEVALFQKLVLYLGTPTVALSILLSSLLAGMGLGSFFSARIMPGQHLKRLKYATGLIVLFGSIAIIVYPWLLHQLLAFDTWIRAMTAFFLLLPLGFLLGIPFPTGIRILSEKQMDTIIPWMYGINGTMSVLGSIIAVTFSMIWGFTPAFFAGILCYALLFVSTLRPDNLLITQIAQDKIK